MAEGRQDFRWTVKVVMQSLNGPRRTRGTDREEQRRAHRSPEGTEPASGPLRSPPRAAPGAALGWQLSAASPPLRYPLISQEKLLTLQELCLYPWPELECPPCLSPEGLSVPQNGFGISCLHEACTGSRYCCRAPCRRALCSHQLRPAGAIGHMFYSPLSPAFLSQGDPQVLRAQNYTLGLFLSARSAYHSLSTQHTPNVLMRN